MQIQISKYFRSIIAFKKAFLLSVLCLITFQIHAQQLPFNGPHDIPGLIEGEDFDLGGEGISYHETDLGLLGPASDYRTATDPDVEVESKPAQSNQFIVGYTADGEWYEYSFNATATDDYIISVMSTSRNQGIKGFQLFIDDVPVSDSILLTPDADWFTDWDEYDSSAVPVTAGEHVLRVEIFSDGPYAINIDYIKFSSASSANDLPLSVNGLFKNNAVLQRNANANIWGKGNPGNVVTITPEWTTALTAEVDADGNWATQIPTGEAGGPYTLSVSDVNSTFNYSDILLGEVWICAGQSNMAMPLGGWGAGGTVTNADMEIANADYPEIRMFNVDRVASFEPVDDVSGFWKVCQPNVAHSLSATAYFFARELHTELNVPVGIVLANRGHSGAEAWTAQEGMATLDGFENVITDLASSQAGNGPYTLDGLFDESFLWDIPSTLFNGMIHPILPYTNQGANWYQGESNVGTHAQYQRLFQAMIQSWRAATGWNEMPFHYVQICPFANYNQNSAKLREAQFFGKDLANTGMAVALDLGDQYQIHPSNKQDVGLRLALWAFSEVYGQSLVRTGPVYLSSEFVDGKGVLTFEDIGSGLKLTTGPNNFEIAGMDGIFFPATAEIVGDQLELSSPDVAEPIQARYAWTNWVEPTLCNMEDLPASSFTTYNAFVFSNVYPVDQIEKEISVNQAGLNMTITEFKSKLTTVTGASFKVTNAAGEEQTSGTMSVDFKVEATMDNGQDTRIYDITLGDFVPTTDLNISDVEVYPNPVVDTLKLFNLPANTKVSISSINGNILSEKTATSSELSFDMSTFSKGIYLLTLENGLAYKVVKE